MGYEISSTLLGRLLAEAKKSPHAEICGLLFGTHAAITASEPCANVAPEPSNSFEIDPGRLLAAHRAMRAGGPRLIGHYHSHPSGVAAPSTRDAAQAMGDGALWIILTPREARLWRTTRVGAFDAMELRVSDS